MTITVRENPMSALFNNVKSIANALLRSTGKPHFVQARGGVLGGELCSVE